MIPGMTDMMMGRRAMLGMGMGALGLAAVARQGRGDGAAAWRWGVDYGAATDPELARRFDLLVLEPHHARPIAPLRGQGSTLLGYVSLGEVEKGRPYFAALDRAGALRAPNPDWPDARHVDLRHPNGGAPWSTSPCPPSWPRAMTESSWIRSITPRRWSDRIRSKTRAWWRLARHWWPPCARDSRHPPDAQRGYAALPDSAVHLDYLLGESMASRWSFAQKRYEMLSDSDWQWQAERCAPPRPATRA